MPFVAYEPAKSCRDAGPGADALMYWLDRESPWAATLGNYGVHVCRLPSIHSEGRAGDSSVPVVRGGHPAGHALVEFLTVCGLQLGVMETIFARRRRSARNPGGAPYTGPSPHWDHVHWAISHRAADHLNVPTVRAVYASYAAGRGGALKPTPPPVVRPPAHQPPPPPPPPPPVPEPPITENDMAGTLTVNIPAHFLNNMTWEFSYGDKGRMYRKYVPRAGDRAKVMIAALAAWGSDPIAVDGPLNNNPKVNMLNVLMERSVDVTPSGDYRVDGYGQLADRQAAAGFR